MTQPLAPNISEAEFSQVFKAYALLRQWRINHQRPAVSQSGRWITATEGHVGAPDWLLARTRNGATRVLLVELKRENGVVRPAQKDWGYELGPFYRLYRPSDWPQIIEELK